MWDVPGVASFNLDEKSLVVGAQLGKPHGPVAPGCGPGHPGRAVAIVEREIPDLARIQPVQPTTIRQETAIVPNGRVADILGPYS